MRDDDAPKPRPFRVWYRMGSSGSKIESSMAVGVQGNVVVMADGGWNPRDESFLSRRQCQLFYGLIPERERVRRRVSARAAILALRRALKHARRASDAISAEIE